MFDLPFDRAAPYYTIWQRQSLLSALAVSLPKPALFSFRIGGVQKFLDQARTTEDFWASSYLISWLTWHAALEIVEAYGPASLIFPALWNQDLVDKWLSETAGVEFGGKPPVRGYGTFPNGLLALVPMSSAEAGRQLGNQVSERFGRTWLDLCEKIRSRLPRLAGARRIWDRQIKPNSVFETFWTITEWDGKESYGDWYSRASRLMESRKTFRGFERAEEPERNIKCHVCGEREALQEHTGYDRNESNEFWRKLPPRDLRYRFRPAERLCAVCTVCRLASRAGFEARKGFPSTSSVAATLFLESLERNAGALEEAAADFRRALQDLFRELEIDGAGLNAFPALQDPPPAGPWQWFRGVDGDWWYEETYEPGRLVSEFGEDAASENVRSKAAAAREALLALGKKCRDAGLTGEPPTYLGLIAADGDRVGDWVSGRLLPTELDSIHPELARAAREESQGDRQRAPGLATHAALSARIGAMPGRIEKIVREHLRGVLVYAGGDDFLALAPLARIADGLNAYGSEVCKPELMGTRFSASAAALLLSHMDPLSGAIQSVHGLLDAEAKERMGRGTGAICIRRQSGQQTVAASRWTVTDPVDSAQQRAFALLQQLTDDFSENRLSPRLVSHFEALAHGLEEIGDPERLFRLARLLVRRAWHEELGEKELPLEPALKVLFADSSVLWQEQERLKLDFDRPWRHVMNLLFAARFLSRFQVGGSR